MYSRGRKGEIRMFLPCVLIHLLLAGACAVSVSVAQESLSVFSYDSLKQVTVLAVSGDTDVICDIAECHEDRVNQDSKLEPGPAKTSSSSLKHSADAVAARPWLPATLREHSSKMDSVDVVDSAADVKEILQSVTTLETAHSRVASDGDVRSGTARTRRAIRNVAFFRRAFKNIGLKGRVLYTAKKVTQLKFEFDTAQFRDVTSEDVMLADLRLYQRAQQRRRQRGRRRRHRVVTVRVSIHQIISRNRRFPRAKLIDSSLLHIGSAGWVSFNVTGAVRDWLSPRHTNQGLQVWAETVTGGSTAARAVRKLRFVSAGSKTRKAKSPAVVLYLRTVQ